MQAMQRTANRAAARTSTRPVLPARRVACKAVGIDETNVAINLIASTAAIAPIVAITTATSENRDKEIERIQTTEGLIPIGAALATDIVTHSIPGLSVLLNILSEPVGAACGVAYMFSLVLSSPAVDPETLAPKGTILGAEKAADVRGKVRVPFTRIIPTLLGVVDTTNDASSGEGWRTGPDGLPKLPINSVLLVLGVGTLILEAAAHAPVLSFVVPRVLQCACWYAAIGYALDKRE